MPFGIGFFASGADSDYRLIATATFSGSTSTVTFDAIPQSFRHLQIRTVTAQNGTDARMNFNDDGAANYAIHRLTGNGSNVSSAGFTGITYIPVTTNTSTSIFTVGVTDILDYASSSKNKTVRTLTGTTSGPAIEVWSGVWLNTNAITKVIIGAGSNFTAGSRISIYGIRG